MTNVLVDEQVYTHVCVCAYVFHLEVSPTIVVFFRGESA